MLSYVQNLRLRFLSFLSSTKMKVIIILVFIISFSFGERCPENDLQCSDGTCVSKEFLCDGHRECYDGDDETRSICQHRSCSQVQDFISGASDLFTFSVSNQFRCSYGACIAHSFVCNGVDDCHDGSDETRELCFKKTCATNKFKCNYGACIPKQQVCNGNLNCKDGSDETTQLCSSSQRRCSRYHFRCDYGACIYGKRKCDGKGDCYDNSDEKKSLCGNDHVFRPSKIPNINLGVSETPTTTKPKPILPEPPPENNPSLIDTILSMLGEGNINIPTSKTPTAPSTPSILSPESPTPEVIATKSPQVTTPSPCKPSECFCPAPLEVCIPCHNVKDPKAVCEQVGNNSLCSLEVGDKTEFDILECGVSYSLDIVGFSRKNIETCGNSDGVPVLTLVLARCWGETSMMLSCQPDGKWHPAGVHEEQAPMPNICQPTALNSPVCGKFSNGQRDPEYQTRGGKSNFWPFLVGLFIKNIFACTGTLISNQWILTATHCVVRSQEVYDSTILSQTIAVQHFVSNKTHDLANVSAIYLHPNYSYVSKPKMDVALLKLDEPITLSSRIFPACVDVTESLLGTNAATFVRNEGEDLFRWKLNTQKLNLDCFNKEGKCARHLDIDQDQFCGHEKKSPSSRLQQGSSGGPYLINRGTDASEKWTVAGVVSHSIDTSGCPFYPVFSSSGFHWPWIQACVEESRCT